MLDMAKEWKSVICIDKVYEMGAISAEEAMLALHNQLEAMAATCRQCPKYQECRKDNFKANCLMADANK